MTFTTAQCRAALHKLWIPAASYVGLPLLLKSVGLRQVATSPHFDYMSSGCCNTVRKPWDAVACRYDVKE
jgi:hypothetical protein